MRWALRHGLNLMVVIFCSQISSLERQVLRWKIHTGIKKWISLLYIVVAEGLSIQRCHSECWRHFRLLHRYWTTCFWVYIDLDSIFIRKASLLILIYVIDYFPPFLIWLFFRAFPLLPAWSWWVSTLARSLVHLGCYLNLFIRVCTEWNETTAATLLSLHFPIVSCDLLPPEMLLIFLLDNDLFLVTIPYHSDVAFIALSITVRDVLVHLLLLLWHLVPHLLNFFLNLFSGKFWKFHFDRLSIWLWKVYMRTQRFFNLYIREQGRR